jgi:hypothetical protein
VAYFSLSNPQTTNLYADVGNNPLTGLDPDGHAPLDCTGSNASGSDAKLSLSETLSTVLASARASSSFGNVNVSYQTEATRPNKSRRSLRPPVKTPIL